MNVYEDVQRLSRNEAVAALASADADQVCRALVSIALHDNDWLWVQETCLSHLASTDHQVGGVAATCLGHLARVHGALDKAKVLEALNKRASDPAISGRISDAIDDVEMFAGTPPID